MRFAVAGVTGHTGKVVADTLLQQGHDVRVIVRDAAKGQPWAARGAEVAVADVADADALALALAGVDGAWLLTPPNFAYGDFRGWQARVGQALLDAVAKAAPPHVVFLSSVGAQHPDGTGPIKGLYPVEQGLASLPRTGATFVRAAYFMENLLGSLGQLEQGVLPSFTPANLAFPMIATEDIGRLGAALLVEGPPAPGSPRVVELGSPRTMADVAAALSAVTGRSVVVAEAPVAVMASVMTGFGFPADASALYQEMTEGLISGLVAFEGGHRRVEATVGLEAFFRGALGR